MTKNKTDKKPEIKSDKKPVTKTLKIDAELYARLIAVTEKTGQNAGRLANLLLDDLITKIEKGGRLTVNLEDGSILISPAPPPIPVVQRPPELDQPVTRKINMRTD